MDGSTIKGSWVGLQKCTHQIDDTRAISIIKKSGSTLSY